MAVAETISSLELKMQMSLLLFVAMAGCIIASRINQSTIITTILLGMVVGPSFLNLITYTDAVRSAHTEVPSMMGP